MRLSLGVEAEAAACYVGVRWATHDRKMETAWCLWVETGAGLPSSAPPVVSEKPAAAKSTAVPCFQSRGTVSYSRCPIASSTSADYYDWTARARIRSQGEEEQVG